jgi:AcrR family transcriptional regulator
MATSRSKGRPAAAMPGPDSRARLLRAARELLAERGLSGFKVLDVAARAQANVAMINYHFGSRDGLLDEVIRLEANSVARERAIRLTRLLDSSSPAAPSPEDVLRCWLEPMFENVAAAENREVMMLMVHLMFAADVSQERKTHLLDEALVVTGRFIDVLAQSLPGVPRETLAWRMLCVVGATYVVLGQRDPIGLRRLASIATDAALPHPAQRLEETLEFLLAGVMTPAVPLRQPGPSKEGLSKARAAPSRAARTGGRKAS